MSKRAIWLTVAIIFLYFIPFTSGFYYWASKSQETTRLIVPFSWALSAEDTGLTGIATQSDLDCVNWLLNESDSDFKIACDSNALYLISGHTELIPDTWAKFGREDRLVTMFGVPKLDECYLFLTDWNIRHGKYIETADVGLRRQYTLQINDNTITYDGADVDEPWNVISITVQAKEVFSSNGSVVYLIKP